MKTSRTIGIALAITFAAAAHAQVGTKDQAAASSRCEKEVRDYLETLRYIRNAAGAQIGNRVEAGFVGEEALRKVQGEQGSCAAAQMIREKTARRS